MGYSIAYNSGSTTPFGTFKQGTITMGLKPQEYTVSSGFTWYANATTPNDNYLIISDTYSQGWSTQQESKPTIWRSETGTTESFVSLVNQLPDVNGVTGFTDSGTAMKYLMDSGKYFVNKDDYLGIVSDGLVLNLDAGWYPSYPGSGTTWKDIKGTNNGTLTNGPTFSSDGGGCIVFDGTNDYVGLNSITLNPSGFTIDMFIYVDSPQPSYANFWSYWGGTASNLEIGVYEVPALTGRFYLKDNTTNSSVLSPYVGNQWSQLTFGCSQRKPFMYTNGLFVQNSETLFRSSNLSLTAIFTASGRYFKGKQGVLRIYNRALTSEEVAQNYNATKGRFGL